MSRERDHRQRTATAKARRQFALQHLGQREGSARRPAAGPTSQAVKIMDDDSAAAIAAYLASRPRGQGGGQ